MLKIDRTCIDLFLGCTLILICLLEGDKKQFDGFFLNFTTCITLPVVDNNVNNFGRLFKISKLII